MIFSAGIWVVSLTRSGPRLDMAVALFLLLFLP
jgi:hypothetical protein